MPRIRSLKPEFFTDSDLGKLSPLARILYEGLWCHADKNGHLPHKADELKVKILPWDDVNVVALLDELEASKADTEHGFIEFYVVDGRRYISIVNWLEHQKPHRQEKALWPNPTLKCTEKGTRGTQEAPVNEKQRTYADETGKKPFSTVSNAFSTVSAGKKTAVIDLDPDLDLDLDPGAGDGSVVVSIDGRTHVKQKPRAPTPNQTQATETTGGFYWDSKGLRIWGSEKERNELRGLWLKLGMSPEEFKEAWTKLNRRIATKLEPVPLDPGARLNNYLVKFSQNLEKPNEGAG